ncbi:Leucine-rich repeat - like 10 [Theobroma cacao]|nr:Leucine-rich repeat - like 10 [Theobroma cacao]
MASTLSSSFISPALIILLLYVSSSSNNLAAKHTYSASPHHRHHNRSPFPNPKLQQAYNALQAWKRVIYSDPHNFTSNWVGHDVCNYTGVFCAPPPYDKKIKVVAGIDLNGADIAGFLPDEFALLSDLALIHINSNRFCGILPQTLANLSLLFELDLSNNRFVGPFPYVVLSLPSLQYLDIRYNEFEGPLPAQLFSRSLDAIFVNNNRFSNVIPSNFVGSSASVVVFANNKLGGCLPPSISNFANTLEELLLINTSLSGLAGLAHLEQLNLAHNMMTGIVPMGVCILPNLANFTFSYNFFCEEEGICQNLTSNGIAFDDRRNCLPEKPNQRSQKECQGVLEHPVDCFHYHCGGVRGSSAAVPPTMMPAGTPLSSPAMAPGYV